LLCSSNKLFLHATQAIRHETAYNILNFIVGSFLHGLLMPIAQKPCRKKLQQFY